MPPSAAYALCAITFEELDELLPDDVVGPESVEQWVDFLHDNAIELVPHRALRNGAFADTEQSFFVSEVELAAGDVTVAAELYWVGRVMWNDSLDRFVFALAGAKVPHAEAAFAERAAALGYAITRTESAITIDLRAMASARIAIAHDDYARDRGGFAAIAPSRVELLTAEPRELQTGYWITNTPVVSFTLLVDVPLFVGPTSHGNVELSAECRMEFREWGIKWLDLSPTSCPLPASVDAAMIAASGASVLDGRLAMRGAQGCRLAAELVTEGNTLGFVATGLHIVAAH